MKKIFLATFIFFLILSPFQSIAKAAPVSDPYYGLNETASQAQLTQTAPSDVPTLLGNVIGAVLTLIGVVFFLLMVYGGFLWMTAHGDAAQVDKGKETIIAAVIGMVIVGASYALTTFVFGATSGGERNTSSINNNSEKTQSFEEGEVKRGQDGEDLGVDPIPVVPVPPRP